MKLSTRTEPVEVNFRESGISILESHHEEGFSMKWRKDLYPKVLFVVGGEGVLHRHQEEFAIRAPALIVVPESAPHRLSDSPGNAMSLYGICFNRPVFPSPSLIRSACRRWRLDVGTDLTVHAAELLKAIMVEERSGSADSEDLQLSYICQLLAAINRDANRGMSDQMLSSKARVIAYVEQLSTGFWKADDLDSVARSLGLSRRRFTSVFREVTGESWLSRLTRLRMEHAAYLLVDTVLSVRSISFECGFAELSSFYRLFRSTHHCSPGEYRELNSKNSEDGESRSFSKP